MQLERCEEQPTRGSRAGSPSLEQEPAPAPYRWGDVVRVALDRSAERGERRIVQVQLAQGAGGYGARDHGGRRGAEPSADRDVGARLQHDARRGLATRRAARALEAAVQQVILRGAGE